jgi:1-carboxybiuret hydrolase subunit AtzG-like
MPKSENRFSDNMKYIGRARMAEDNLDAFLAAAVAALGIPLEESWKPAVKANLEVTLRHAATVEAFKLPDEAEPAPVFEA